MHAGSKGIHQGVVTSDISFLVGHAYLDHRRIDGTVPKCSLHFRQIHVPSHHVRSERSPPTECNVAFGKSNESVIRDGKPKPYETVVVLPPVAPWARRWATRQFRSETQVPRAVSNQHR